jgi:hypothetical protein
VASTPQQSTNPLDAVSPAWSAVGTGAPVCSTGAASQAHHKEGLTVVFRDEPGYPALVFGRDFEDISDDRVLVNSTAVTKRFEA